MIISDSDSEKLADEEVESVLESESEEDLDLDEVLDALAVNSIVRDILRDEDRRCDSELEAVPEPVALARVDETSCEEVRDTESLFELDVLVEKEVLSVEEATGDVDVDIVSE